MGGGNLGADACLSLGHHGIEEAYGIHAFVQELCGKLLGQNGIPQHHRGNRVILAADGEAGAGHRAAEIFGIGFHAVARFRGTFQKVQHLDGRGHDRRGHAVGKQVGARLLAQDVHHFLRAGNVAAGRAAQGFAECPRRDIYLAEQAAVLMRPASPLAKEARGVAVVEMDDGVVFGRQFVNLVKLGNDAVHGKDAVRGNQLDAGAGGVRLLQLGFQVRHVVVGVAEALGLAEAHPVDDGGMVQGIGNNGVVRGQQPFEQAAVGVKAGGEENRVFRA